jgi:preprotein translocase subunit SecG
MGPVFALVLSILAIFLILLVLVQRGRGGGLAGALGGMGGSSAFGAKAGDVFTRITIIVASIWIAICLLALFWAKHRGDALGSTGTRSIPAADSSTLPAQTAPPLTGPAAPGDTKAAPAAGTTEPAGTAGPAGPAGEATTNEAPPGK